MPQERPYIKKPDNAFMLYLKEQRAHVPAEIKKGGSAAVCKHIGRLEARGKALRGLMWLPGCQLVITVVIGLWAGDCAPLHWSCMSREQQYVYYKAAEMQRCAHKLQFPDWSTTDNYGKKRKRERRRACFASGDTELNHPSKTEHSWGQTAGVEPNPVQAAWGILNNPPTVTQPETQPVLQPMQQPFLWPEQLPVVQSVPQPFLWTEQLPFIQPEPQPFVRPEQLPFTQPEPQPFLWSEQQPFLRPEQLSFLKPVLQPFIWSEQLPFLGPEHIPSIQPEPQPFLQPEQLLFLKSEPQPFLGPEQFPSTQPELQPSTQPEPQPFLQSEQLPFIQTALEAMMQLSPQSSPLPPYHSVLHVSNNGCTNLSPLHTEYQGHHNL